MKKLLLIVIALQLLAVSYGFVAPVTQSYTIDDLPVWSGDPSSPECVIIEKGPNYYIILVNGKYYVVPIK